MLFSPKAMHAFLRAHEKFRYFICSDDRKTSKPFLLIGKILDCIFANQLSDNSIYYVYFQFISLIFIEGRRDGWSSLHINERVLGSLAILFLTLGCVPAYFHVMFYAIVLWMFGFATLNTHVFVLSRKKF
jgi:hypothetical protein